MRTKPKQTESKTSGRRWLWWLGGGTLTVLAVCLGRLYLRGTFRAEPQYQISNAPNLDDPRFPLLEDV